MRRVLFVFICLLSITAAAPAQAKNTFLNYLFPSIFGKPDLGPQPEDTLIAPFAQDTQRTRTLSETEKKALSSPENNVPITIPHRSAKYVADWASEQVTSLFVYNPEKIKSDLIKNKTDLSKILPSDMGAFLLSHHLKKLDAGYTPSAADGAKNFLNQALIMPAMAQQQHVQAFAKTVPQIMNEGVFNGVYRWLIDVPVTISIMPPGMENYAGKNKKIATETQSLTIRLQIMRTPANSGFVDGMAIETFTVLGASS